MPTMKQRVVKGAYLLDRADLKWYEKVDLGTLDMQSLTHCVLGEVFGSLCQGSEALAFKFGPEWTDKELSDFGFNVAHEDWSEVDLSKPTVEALAVPWNKLYDLWEQQIRRRIG